MAAKERKLPPAAGVLAEQVEKAREAQAQGDHWRGADFDLALADAVVDLSARVYSLCRFVFATGARK